MSAEVWAIRVVGTALSLLVVLIVVLALAAGGSDGGVCGG